MATPPAPRGDRADPDVSWSATSRAARNATALVLAAVASRGLAFVWQLVLARWLGAARYGTYGTIGALLAIGAAIPEFGMGLIVIRDVARRPPDAGRYLGATLVLQPVLAALGYLGLLTVAALLGYEAGLRALLAFAAVSLLVDALGTMGHNQLLAVERMALTAAISVGHVALLVALGAVALAAGAGLWGLYAATLAAGLGRTGLYWLVLRRTGCRPVVPVDRAIARTLLADGLPIAAMSLLGLAFTHSDKLITTALLGPAGTGQLTAAFVVVFGVIELLNTTVLVAIFPLMSRRYAAGERDRIDFLLEKLVLLTLVSSVPLAVCTSLLAVFLATSVFGDAFAPAADVLRILIWYAAVTMVTNVFASALVVQNRQTRLLVVRATGLALNVILNVVLLPRLGVPGAALATLLAEITVLALVLASFDLPLAWWQRTGGRGWRLAVAAVALAGFVTLLRETHPLAAVLVGLPLYAGLLLISGAVTEDDRDLIRRLVVAMPGGETVERWWKGQLA